MSGSIERFSIRVAKSAIDSVTTARVVVDVGFLLTKIVFLDHGDTPEEYTMHFLLMPNASFSEGLATVKSECSLLDPAEAVKVTGLGYRHEEAFRDVLGAASEFVVEPLCWIRGYHWSVEHLKPEDLFYPPEHSDPCFCKRGSMAGLEEFPAAGHDALALPGPGPSGRSASALAEPPAKKFPAVVVNAGSSVGMCVVNELGQAVRLSLSHFSCKTLAGLATLLLGTGDFADIVRLAELGDRGNVDLRIAELTAADPVHPFGAYCGEIPLLHLGKIADAAVKPAEAKREDLARSLVSLFCFNLYSSVLAFAAGAQIDTVYLGGNCFRHRLFRREFENAVAFRLHRTTLMRHRFLRVGAQVGSIGALVSSNHQVPGVIKFGTDDE